MRSEGGSEEAGEGGRVRGDGGDDRFGRRLRAIRDEGEGRAAFHGWDRAGSHGRGAGQGSDPHPVPDPVPDPFSDPDPLRELEEQILQLSFHIEAAGQRRLAMIAEFDRRRGWELGGHRSAAHWLAARAGLELFTAREMVRTARALEELPLTTAALALGRVTFSQVRALTRVATADTEDELLELSYGRTVAAVERLVRGWRMRAPEDEVAREQARQEARRLTVRPRLDGNYEVRGVLTPEQGALLMRAVDWASDLLFRGEGGDTGPATRAARELAEALLRQGPTAETAAAAGRRRADALTLLAEVAMAAAGSERAAAEARLDSVSDVAPDPRSCGCGCAELSHEVPVEHAADLPQGRPLPNPIPISGTSAARYQVVLHVDLETLQRGGDPAGRSELADGIRVSHETSRRLSCDAGLVPLVQKLLPDGRKRILEIGRLRRPVSQPLRRALEARDGGCRFPGCSCCYTEAHHVVHWADGGETSLANCILLCRHHHRLLHEGGWSMTMREEGRPIFLDPHGGTHYDGRWTPPRIPPDVVADLVRGNLRGEVMGPWSSDGRWDDRSWDDRWPDDRWMDAAG